MKTEVLHAKPWSGEKRIPNHCGQPRRYHVHGSTSSKVYGSNRCVSRFEPGLMSQVRELSSCSIRTIAKSGRCASISVPIASRIERQLHPCPPPQRPCKIACRPTIADFGVQTLQGPDSQGSLVRSCTCNHGQRCTSCARHADVDCHPLGLSWR